MAERVNSANSLNENKEVHDVIHRELDLCDGITIELKEKNLHKAKVKSKKAIFKDVHNVEHNSTFIDIDKVRDIIMDNTSIEFCEESMDSPDACYQEPALDLEDFINLIDLEQENI